jgi:excisionase family DNA binding protein
VQDDLLKGAKRAADFLGLPKSTIYNMVKGGQLPVIRKNNRMYFRKSELDAAFQSQAGQS